MNTDVSYDRLEQVAISLMNVTHFRIPEKVRKVYDDFLSGKKLVPKDIVMHVLWYEYRKRTASQTDDAVMFQKCVLVHDMQTMPFVSIDKLRLNLVSL